jgi:hypothetical protein
MADRRASHRFPVRLAVKYRTLGSGPGAEWFLTESVNISSGGVFFQAPDAVSPGQSLEACFAWPVLLDKHIPLRLVTKGPVVRNDAAGAAMRFETYEFRTGQIHADAQNVTAMRSDTHLSGDTGLKIAG